MGSDVLIDPATLQSWQGDDTLVLLDVRYSLQDAAAGKKLYRHSHIPNAQFVDLDHDLAAPHVAGATGRHPLPRYDDFVSTLQGYGISNTSRVVIYDDGSHLFAPRLWWMLNQWLGHDKVFVLHGGFRRWQAEHLPVTDVVPVVPQGLFTAQPHSDVLMHAEDIPAFVARGGVLLDARAPERYSGAVEPLDPKAGHIPGAICLPCLSVLDSDGDFLSVGALKALFAKLEGHQSVYYCGSGVTACLGILAMVVADVIPAKLYVGSWSEWITEPGRPVAIGSEIG